MLRLCGILPTPTKTFPTDPFSWLFGSLIQGKIIRVLVIDGNPNVDGTIAKIFLKNHFFHEILACLPLITLILCDYGLKKLRIAPPDNTHQRKG
jgi:hypothetical protein